MVNSVWTGAFLMPEKNLIMNEKRKDMDYETFKMKLSQDIYQTLCDSGMENVTMRFQNIEKLNQNYESLTVIPENGVFGATLNLETAFAEYSRNGDYKNVLDKSVDVVLAGIDRMPTVDLENLLNYEAMKKTLAIDIISAERNETLLQKVPHELMEDMAAVYRFVLNNSEAGRETVLVTKDMLNNMGITEEQLMSDAKEIAPKIRPVVIQGMNEVMKEKMGEEEFEKIDLPNKGNEILFLASVPDGICGAGVLAYPNFMEQAADIIGGDFFILPSSIHEVLLVPDDGSWSARALKALVENVNETEVRPEEKLTDSVYHYDSKAHIFELAEKFEDRKNFRDYEKTEEKDSVLKSLKEKKEASADVLKNRTVESEKKVRHGEVR